MLLIVAILYLVVRRKIRSSTDIMQKRRAVYNHREVWE